MAIIDKLRGVDILSPQLGEEPARQTVEWLQDEMRPLAGGEKLDVMLAQIDARFSQSDARFANMEAQIWRAAFVLAAILLTALGIATGLIIALN